MKYTFEELWNRLPEDVRTSMENCEQDPRWHPEGVVSVHTKLVFEYAQNNFDDDDLLLCAIFHDLGKPETKRVTELPGGQVKISNYGHENKAEKYIDKYIHLFSDVSKNVGKIKTICKNHMRAHMYNDGRLSKPSKRKSFENLEYFDDIINFSMCDENGR